MLNNLRYWIAHNKANLVNEHDGKTWTYNSVKAFETLFPYLSANQIRRCLESLVAQGVLVRGNYNSSPYDKTTWFAFSSVEIEQIDLANLPKGTGEKAQSETDLKTKLKTTTTTTGKTMIPENFEPNETAVQLANETGVSIADQLPAFKDHHTANGATFADWQAAFRMWMRNSAKFAKQDLSGAGRSVSAKTASNRNAHKFAGAAAAIWGSDNNERTIDV